MSERDRNVATAGEIGRRTRGDDRHFGVRNAEVVDIVDPEGQGRVRVRLPWADDPGGEPLELWARMATLMAGAHRGSWFLPDVGDEVLVAFEAGDVRHPYVVGALWNGLDRPPEAMDGNGDNALKSLTSRNGVKVTFDDSSGEEKLTLETPGGNVVSLADDVGRIEIADSHGNRVRLDATGVTVETSGTAKIDAATLEATAGQLKVEAGLSTFSGVVKCDSLITNSVVASSYTPGAGNIW